MRLQPVLLTALACLAIPSTAWQQEIHNQIGFMAQETISPETKRMAEMILEPEYNGSLGRAGGWADTVRKTTHRFSYSWHFISAKDNPPNDCGLYYHRDCQTGGCVVQQITNQTAILEKCIEDLGDGVLPSPTPSSCSEALKFIIHFVGDVSQPLHTSERSLGGNSVSVMFNGTKTNLHSVWDKEIYYAIAPIPSDGLSVTRLDPYFSYLLTRIRKDAYRSPISTWAGCDLDARRGTYCPEQWAKDSNVIVCDYAYGVLVNGSDLWTGQDKYAAGAYQIILEQIAKGAWRLSHWLDALVKRVLESSELRSESSLSVQEL